MWIEVFYEQGRNFGKNRAENKNKDIYEQEVLKQASTSASIVMTCIASIFLEIITKSTGRISWCIPQYNQLNRNRTVQSNS